MLKYHKRLIFSETLQFLLPNLVLQILLKGSENAIGYVLTEIQAVLYATQNEVVSLRGRRNWIIEYDHFRD